MTACGRGHFHLGEGGGDALCHRHIVISHFALPHAYGLWGIAAFFLIAMLFTYPAAAWRFSSGAHFSISSCACLWA